MSPTARYCPLRPPAHFCGVYAHKSSLEITIRNYGELLLAFYSLDLSPDDRVRAEDVARNLSPEGPEPLRLPRARTDAAKFEGLRVAATPRAPDPQIPLRFRRIAVCAASRGTSRI
jgi:hypothetical protein